MHIDVHAISLNSKPLLAVVSVNEISLEVLIDSGSSLSIIDESVLKVLGILPEQLQPWHNAPLRTANGSPLEIFGLLELRVLSHPYSIAHEFVVAASLAHKVILGQDFLLAGKPMIDYKSKTITFVNGATISFQDRTDSEGSHSRDVARVKETQDVPARAQVVIQLISDKIIESTSKYILLEPIAAFMAKYGVLVSNTVCTPTTLFVMICNPSSKSIRLYKDTVVAAVEGISETQLSVCAMTFDPLEDSTTKGPAPSRSRDTVGHDDSVFTPEVCPLDDDLRQKVNDSDIICADLDKKGQLYTLLSRRRAQFATNSSGPGYTQAEKHSIDSGNARPIKQQLRRVSPAVRAEQESAISEMLANGIIQPSRSPWGSPILMVPKKDGTRRFCVDFRKLNSVTTRDVYPLPRIEDVLDALSGAQWFSSLDLASGYWQIPVREEDRPKTAFISQAGLFEFKVMPFGLTNAPPTFQRFMNAVLAGLVPSQCLVYLDDIIVRSTTFEQHLLDLEAVFDRLMESNLHLKLSKCHFAKNQLPFLGHIVSGAGVSPDPAKLEAVASFPTPLSVVELQQFLGLAGYYRRFIANFSTIAEPLYALTRKNSGGRVAFTWGADQAAAFVQLRAALTSAPILAYPNPHWRYILRTDASKVGVGAILQQQDPISGDRFVLAYASRTLSEQERRYSATELECLAVVWGTKQFKSYLLGVPVVIESDHQALSWLRKNSQLTDRLYRWALHLEQFEYTITYKPGKEQLDVDALSRKPLVTAATVNAIVVMPVGQQQLRNAQQEDEYVKALAAFVRDGVLPNDQQLSKRIVAIAAHCFLEEGLLWFDPPMPDRALTSTPRLVIPTSLRNEILERFHSDPLSGHLGVHKTHDKLRMRYYWPNMFATVEDFLKNCQECQSRKPTTQTNVGMLQPIVVTEPWHTVGLDLVGPLPKTHNGNIYILCFTDYFTKMVEASAIPTADASTVADCLLEKVILNHGAPVKLVSDRGSVFTSALMAQLTRLLRIQQAMTTAYHPQADGLIERFNGTLLRILSKLASTNQLDWDQYIQHALFAYRTSVHKSTKFTPFFMDRGREARTPTDVALGSLPTTDTPRDAAEYVTRQQEVLRMVFKLAQENLQEAHATQADNYNANRVPLEFNEGDRVYVEAVFKKKGRSAKLAPRWNGPYFIKKKISPLVYKLKTQSGKVLKVPVNIQRLKKDPATHQFDMEHMLA